MFPNKFPGEFCVGFLGCFFLLKNQRKKSTPKLQQSSNQNLGVSQPKSTLRGSTLDKWYIAAPFPGLPLCKNPAPVLLTLGFVNSLFFVSREKKASKKNTQTKFHGILPGFGGDFVCHPASLHVFFLSLKFHINFIFPQKSDQGTPKTLPRELPKNSAFPIEEYSNAKKG